MRTSAAWCLRLEVKETKVEPPKSAFAVMEGCTSSRCTSGTPKGGHLRMMRSWTQFRSSTARTENLWTGARHGNKKPEEFHNGKRVQQARARQPD